MLYSEESLDLSAQVPQSADMILETGQISSRSPLLGGLHNPFSHLNPTLPVYRGSVLAYICSLIQVFQLHL